jgi:molybdopterin molybdotransferase
MHVVGLPGNPVSAFVCAFLFLIPLIRRLSGREDLDAALEEAVLGRALPANDERADYLRATLSPGAGELPIATPFPLQDSSLLTPLAGADCLLLRKPNAPATATGDRCFIIKLGL